MKLSKYIKYKTRYIKLKNNYRLLYNEKIFLLYKKDDLLDLLSNKFTKNEILKYLSFLNKLYDFKFIVNCSKKMTNNLKIIKNKIVNNWYNLSHYLLNIYYISHKDFTNTQIFNIELLGYKLLERDKIIMNKAFNNWLLCNTFPAPFSITSVFNKQKYNYNMLITVAEHCLYMATYWYYNPPIFLKPYEINELIVLSIFHDIFYFENFQNHDKMVLKLFTPYIQSELIREIIGTHLDFISNKNYNFNDTPSVKFKKKWSMLDEYFTDTIYENDKIHILPLEFFYKHIGDFIIGSTYI